MKGQAFAVQRKKTDVVYELWTQESRLVSSVGVFRKTTNVLSAEFAIIKVMNIIFQCYRITTKNMDTLVKMAAGELQTDDSCKGLRPWAILPEALRVKSKRIFRTNLAPGIPETVCWIQENLSNLLLGFFGWDEHLWIWFSRHRLSIIEDIFHHCNPC